jgi:hypothetical protein
VITDPTVREQLGKVLGLLAEFHAPAAKPDEA